MQTNLNFEEINNGLHVDIEGNSIFIPWDSSFFDLYGLADSTTIRNLKNDDGTIVRSVSFEFKNQEIIYSKPTATVGARLDDTELNLQTRGINSFHIDLNLYGKEAEEYNERLKHHLDKLISNGQPYQSEHLNIGGIKYSLIDNIELELICSDFWSKGTVYNLIIIITKN